MDFKQAIIVRSDLDMGKGKIAGQCAHAAVLGYAKVLSKDSDIAEAWENSGQKKIVLKIPTEKEFFELFAQVKREIPCALVQDAGMTQLEPGTATCFSIGPWNSDEIDKFTSKLKLL